MGSDRIIDNPDDPCPEHPDNIIDSYSHEMMVCGQCVHCEGWLRVDKYRGPQADLVILDEAPYYAETGELFDKPSDFDQAEPFYRIKVEGCDAATCVEMTLDAAELDFMRRLADRVRKTAGDHTCMPRMDIHRRVKPGDMEDDENFVIEYSSEC